ncbi:hypothetical protein [Plasticicumulans acidivorans]|uniref:Cysteine rich repeat protein n=1 Tax=Plasticicumulans acidivorans TaxID=886464 RepID=A0A317N0E2_9GAMM|nr:hypothetical protein [Plasticicumulans acidivorans]PWV65590.1 hypothetical protein C7443_10174 [Plasticicumulans acidivorans]
MRMLRSSLSTVLAVSLLASSLPLRAEDSNKQSNSAATSCEDLIAQQVRKQCPKNASRLCAEEVRRSMQKVCSPEQAQQPTSPKPAEVTEATDTAAGAGAAASSSVVPFAIAGVIAAGLAIAAGANNDDGSSGGGSTPTHAGVASSH